MTEHKRKKLKTTSDSDKAQVNTKHSDKNSQNIKHTKQKKITSQPNTKKSYTVSVAIPGSIIDNAQSIELKTYLAGQLARSFAVFNVDEIVIFNELGIQIDSHTKNKREEGISSDPNVFLARILQYLETPQYLRKELFPVHQDLTYAGLLNPLDCPHHVRKEEKSQFREGVIINKKSSGETSLVNAGLSKHVIIDKSIKPGVRVTLDMGNYEVSKNDNQYIEAKVISPKVPKQHGLYWGYNIRIADSISKVFTECSYPDGYDVAIGTSERGKVVDDIIDNLPEFNHLLIVFGGLGGIEAAIDVDEDLKCSGEEADALFDLWVNTCPNQGSRTIRTEEAVLITMSALRVAINKKGRKEN